MNHPADPTRSFLRFLSFASLVIVYLALNVGVLAALYAPDVNRLALFWLIPVYLAAGWGFLQGWRRPIVQLCAGVFAGHALIVALTVADYDGRFLLYILPLIQVRAAALPRVTAPRA